MEVEDMGPVLEVFYSLFEKERHLSNEQLEKQTNI